MSNGAILLVLLLSLVGCEHHSRGQSLPPLVQIECPAATSNPIKLTSKISNQPQSAKLSYRWVVSAGTIISGQETSAVEVDLTGLNLVKVTATVVVSGLGDNCTHAASCTFPVVFVFDPKLDEFTLTSIGDIAPRLDNFAIQLQNNPDSIGYLVVYAGRRAYVGEALEKGFEMTSYLTRVRSTGGGRLVVIDGGYREQAEAELFVVSNKSSEFKFTPTGIPTVDPREVVIVPKKSGGDKGRRRQRHNPTKD